MKTHEVNTSLFVNELNKYYLEGKIDSIKLINDNFHYSTLADTRLSNFDVIFTLVAN